MHVYAAAVHFVRIPVWDENATLSEKWVLNLVSLDLNIAVLTLKPFHSPKNYIFFF